MDLGLSSCLFLAVAGRARHACGDAPTVKTNEAAAIEKATASKTVGGPIHQPELNHKAAGLSRRRRGTRMAQPAARDDEALAEAAAAPLPLCHCAIAAVAMARLVSLVVAAATTLTLPLAVRRMIDHGFSSSDSTFIANYFAMLVVIAAVLAAASAGRYYFVITLGERVVADLRQRRVRPCHDAVARLLRHGAVRRDRVAADRRHDADQVGGRRHRVAWRCATPSSVSARSP